MLKTIQPSDLNLEWLVEINDGAKPRITDVSVYTIALPLNP
jgi:hypothetical protein